MTWSAALAAEGAWFTTDTLPSFPTAAPLQKANGGKFDGIYVGEPDTLPAGRNLVITQEYPQGAQELEERIAVGYKTQTLHFRAQIYWQAEETTGLAAEVLAVRQAMDDVIARIRGPFGDKSHGGAFVDVGELDGGIRDEWDEDPEVSIPESSTARVALCYVAHLYLIGV